MATNDHDDDGGEKFPPAGWVTNHEAARRLGVSFNSLLAVNWKWRAMLGAGAKIVRHPNGGRCKIYTVEAIERIIAAREAASAPAIPDGFVDKDGACRMFGVNIFTWKKWIHEGRVRCGQTIPASTGGRRTIYAVEDLERLKEELFGADKLYKSADNAWHVPAGYVRREAAWEQFGVQKVTWERWEREGKIACGQRVPGGPKLYAVQDIERMLAEYGTYRPPYPDPEQAGVYRVPLSGHDIKRREALIDADALKLIEGGRCTWSMGDGSGFVAFSGGGGGGEMKGVPLRRLIMGVEASGLNVRHVNGDPLDCRRANLVVRTVRQRTWNNRKMVTVKGRPPSSRFKGVYWDTGTKRWRARIGVAGKVHWLGRFGDEIAAAVAYDEAARQWFGEHARLNFPDGVAAWLENEGFISSGDRAAAA